MLSAKPLLGFHIQSLGKFEFLEPQSN